jgi:hypothetical protein
VQEQTSGFTDDITGLRNARVYPGDGGGGRNWVDLGAGPGNCKVLWCTPIGALPGVIQRTGAALKVCNDVSLSGTLISHHNRDKRLRITLENHTYLNSI